MSDIDPNKAAYLAAWLEDEPEEEEVKPDAPKVERPHGIMNMPLMSSKIRKMEEIIAEQERMIKRLTQRVKNLERTATNISRQVSALDGEMDNKLDRRTF